MTLMTLVLPLALMIRDFKTSAGEQTAATSVSCARRRVKSDLSRRSPTSQLSTRRHGWWTHGEQRRYEVQHWPILHDLRTDHLVLAPVIPATQSTLAGSNSRRYLTGVHQYRSRGIRADSSRPRPNPFLHGHPVETLYRVPVVVSDWSCESCGRGQHLRSGSFALSDCIRTMMSSAGLPRKPATPPAMAPAKVSLYPGIGGGPGVSAGVHAVIVRVVGSEWSMLREMLSAKTRQDPNLTPSPPPAGARRARKLTSVHQRLCIIIRREPHHRIGHLPQQRPCQPVIQASEARIPDGFGHTGEHAFIARDLHADFCEVEGVGHGARNGCCDTCAVSGGSGQRSTLRHPSWRVWPRMGEGSEADSPPR